MDTERLYFKANRETLEREGVALRRQDFVRHFMKSNRGMRAIAEEQGWSASKLEEVRAARNLVHDRLLRTHSRAFPWARGVVRRLSRFFRMALVTSSYRRHVMLLDRKFGLLKYMEFVVCEGDFERSKPDPEPYLVAMKRMGLPPSACVVVEDSERGLAAARAAGLRCVVVPNPMTRGGDFRGAWKVLRTLKELPDVLCHLLRREKGSP